VTGALADQVRQPGDHQDRLAGVAWPAAVIDTWSGRAAAGDGR
jgi:hypothetical protein